jgi:hypothetical protein
MLRTRDEPYMRVADYGLDLNDEAIPTANAMYTILQEHYKWSWPDEEKNLLSWQDHRGSYIRDSEEDGEENGERERLWKSWPKRKTQKQYEWLRCASITSCALYHLQQCHEAGLVLSGKSKEGYYYAFDPKDFYQYFWICLCQGDGTQVWKAQPPTPPKPDPHSGAWYASSADNILHQIVADWEQGKDLEDMVPTLTLDDLLPAPKDIETISLIKAKTEPYIHQTDQNNHP